jgi:hypothetical protein
LRNAIGDLDADGSWRPVKPDPQRLEQATEPHDRGAILVAAMFAAFLDIYKVRSKNVITLASAGSGVLPEGALHPSLVDALASEATKAARHFLHVSIRALDYCPPFDITYGDYLRALVTADYDMVPSDKFGYRVALIESFRRWGIVPDGLKALSEEQLRWPYARLEYEENDGVQWNALAEIVTELSALISKSLYLQDRQEVFNNLKEARRQTHEYLARILSLSNEGVQRKNFMKVTGLDLRPDGSVTGLRYKSSGLPSFEVHSVLPTLRVTPDGQIMKQLIISVTQRLVGIPMDQDNPEQGVFDFRGGSTLIFDMDGKAPNLRYAITRPIGDVQRLEAIQKHRRSRHDQGFSLRETYFDPSGESLRAEPFCFLHSDH